MTHHLPNQAQAELPRRPAQSQVPVLTTTGALVCREAAHNVRGKLRFCRRSAPRCGPQHGRPLWPPLDFSSAKQPRLKPGHTHAGKQFHSMRVCHRSASGRPLSSPSGPPEAEPEPEPPDSPAQETGRNRIHVQPPTPRIQHSPSQKACFPTDAKPPSSIALCVDPDSQLSRRAGQIPSAWTADAPSNCMQPHYHSPFTQPVICHAADSAPLACSYITITERQRAQRQAQTAGTSEA